jgi:hypothetical protein
LFDNHLISVKEYDFSSENDKNSKNKILTVSIDELKQIYNIPEKRITAFKKHFKVLDSKKSKVDSVDVYNIHNYPLTNVGNKWLTISYLVPFLMYTSNDFNYRMSNIIFNLLGYSTCHENYMKEFESIINTGYASGTTPALSIASTVPKDNDNKENDAYLVLFKPKFIKPRLITSDPDAQQLDFTAQTLLSKSNDYIAYYNNINTKNYNPADVSYIKTFNLKKNGQLTNTIKIIKMKSSDFDESGHVKPDTESYNILHDIRIKNVKNKNYVSLPACESLYKKIDEDITLSKIFSYLQKNPDSNVQIVESKSNATGQRKPHVTLKINNPNDDTFKALCSIIESHGDELKAKNTHSNQTENKNNVDPNITTNILNAQMNSMNPQTMNVQTINPQTMNTQMNVQTMNTQMNPQTMNTQMNGISNITTSTSSIPSGSSIFNNGIFDNNYVNSLSNNHVNSSSNNASTDFSKINPIPVDNDDI